MTTIFTDTLTLNDNANDGLSIRQVCTITGGALDQVRVTLKASGSAALHTDHCSIGVLAGAQPNTVAVPVELTFSGASGFSILAGASITSDWVNFSGFTSSNKLIIIFDVNSGAGSGNFE